MGLSDILGITEFTFGGKVMARMEVHDVHKEEIDGHDVVWIDWTICGERQQALMSSAFPNLMILSESK